MKLLLVAFLSAVMAHSVNSLPEFECTLLDIKNADKGINFYGLKKHSALSLRSTAERWYLDLAKFSLIFKATEVKKNSDLVLAKTDYTIALSDYRTLTLSLTGRPPSRNGILKVTNSAKELFSGRVTCH